MHRYLFIADVALAILGASMVIGVGVSALLLALHLDEAPQYRDQVGTLLLLTAVYTATTVAATVAAWLVRRRHRAQAGMQLVLVVTCLVSYFISLQALSAP